MTERIRVVRKWNSAVRFTIVGIITTGCATTQVAPPEEPPVPEGPPIVQPGDRYVMYYVLPSGVRIRDTAVEIDSVVVPGATELRAKVSPDNSHLAVSYRQGDSTKVSIVNGASGAMWTVHAAAGDADYTFAWASGSDALGVGYRPLGAGHSAVMMADLNGNVRDIGCSVSNRFIAWRTDGQVVVRDDRNIYTVDVRNCRTLATLPMRGKTDITYSTDGNRVFFVRNGGLFVAAYNGANTRGVAASRYRPRNGAWSPDNNKIAFEVQSQRFANVTHIAVYDLSTGRARFDFDEGVLGVGRDADPCWSPSSRRIAHDRFYARRSADGRSYEQRQSVVTSASRDDEDVVLDEFIRDPSLDVGGCDWIDETHLAILSADGPKIVNVSTKVAYAMPRNSRLLYARVVD